MRRMNPRPSVRMFALALAVAFPLPASLRAQGAEKPAVVEPPAKAAPAKDDYQAYKGHAIREVLTLEKDGSGKAKAKLDGAKLEAVLDDLGSHARNYPPTFRDDRERRLAERDLKDLSKMFSLLLDPKRESADVELLLLAGQAEAMGHNLDLAGASDRAVGYFERLLKLSPDHALGHLHYGMHLAGTAKGQKDGIVHLEKAAALGVVLAHRGLGIAHLILGDRGKSAAHLKQWLAKNPTDEASKRMLEAIESGAKIESVDGPAPADGKKPVEPKPSEPKPADAKPAGKT